jgi:cytochrome c-type biogenesis protein CcmF
MFHSTYNDGLMRNPDIVNLITKDFYLAPLSLDESKGDAGGAVEKSVFKPGQRHTVGELEITFLGFDLPLVHNAAMMQGKDQRVAARLLVQKYGMKPVVITPAKVMQQGNLKDEPATFDQQFEFTIQGMSPERESRENSFVEIGVKNLLRAAAQDPAGGRDVLVVEASIKPFINLVWSGVIIVLVGFLVTIIRRSKEAALRSPVEETVSD